MATRIFKGGEERYCTTEELLGELANGWSVENPADTPKDSEEDSEE